MKEDGRVGGLRCDSCEFHDPEIVVTDRHINTPCPRCHANLLTLEDYNTFMDVQFVTKMINGKEDTVRVFNDEMKRRVQGISDIVSQLAEASPSGGQFLVDVHQGVRVKKI